MYFYFFPNRDYAVGAVSGTLTCAIGMYTSSLTLIVGSQVQFSPCIAPAFGIFVLQHQWCVALLYVGRTEKCCTQTDILQHCRAGMERWYFFFLPSTWRHPGILRCCAVVTSDWATWPRFLLEILERTDAVLEACRRPPGPSKCGCRQHSMLVCLGGWLIFFCGSQCILRQCKRTCGMCGC